MDFTSVGVLNRSFYYMSKPISKYDFIEWLFNHSKRVEFHQNQIRRIEPISDIDHPPSANEYPMIPFVNDMKSEMWMVEWSVLNDFIEITNSENINVSKINPLRRNKNMKKLFISQPMVDKTDAEIKAVRAQAIEDAKKIAGEEIEVIDSFMEGAPHDAKPLWFLGKSFQMLSNADYAYFADGWNDYRGCSMEHKAAQEYGIKIIHD